MRIMLIQVIHSSRRYFTKQIPVEPTYKLKVSPD